jgi:hypothetical protein
VTPHLSLVASQVLVFHDTFQLLQSPCGLFEVETPLRGLPCAEYCSYGVCRAAGDLALLTWSNVQAQIAINSPKFAFSNINAFALKHDQQSTPTSSRALLGQLFQALCDRVFVFVNTVIVEIAARVADKRTGAYCRYSAFLQGPHCAFPLRGLQLFFSTRSSSLRSRGLVER